MTTVVISQPMLFPWPGFFEQLQLADVFIHLDDVQFSKGSFTNRVQLQHGDETRWLTVPLQGKGSFQLIKDLRPANDSWRRDHVTALTSVLAAAPNCAEAVALLREAYAEDSVVDALIASIDASARKLGIGADRSILKSSEMDVSGRSWQRVLDLVLSVGGTRYLTGHGAAEYLDHSAFEAAGVTVLYMDYSLTTWPRDGSTATPYLSVLDLIAWAGENAASYLHPATLSWTEFLQKRELNNEQ
ncbi:WbqC family protein [Bosea vaviloviae]|uniref:WbqC family protein n=1 Tax=Bosea vaviloviae TaxID=1526658 RepID=A0A1D7TZ44_9HYPH|nr:WbqC family protein [Bosea vaviloviae]AOO80385.1 hypothetical protein BHK69_07825 [Bosea vaviloviae]